MAKAAHLIWTEGVRPRARPFHVIAVHWRLIERIRLAAPRHTWWNFAAMYPPTSRPSFPVPQVPLLRTRLRREALPNDP